MDWPIGIPTSEAIRAPSSSERAASPPEIAEQASRRSARGTCDQVSKPALAASTARSTSSGVPWGTVPMTSSVVESITSIVPEPAGSTHSPPT